MLAGWGSLAVPAGLITQRSLVRIQFPLLISVPLSINLHRMIHVFMDAKNALKSSIKYNSVATVPTILGFVLIGVGLYVSIGQPLIELQEILMNNDLQWILDNDQKVADRLISATSPIFGFILGVFGYATYRIGRTFLIFYFSGKMMEVELQRTKENAETVEE